MPVDDVETQEESEAPQQQPEQPIEIASAETPQRLVNTRVSTLRGSDRRQSPAVASTSDDADNDLLESFNSAERADIEAVLDEDSPSMKRTRYEGGYDRSTPEYARTPYLLEKTRQFLQKRLDAAKPTESEKKKMAEMAEKRKQATVSITDWYGHDRMTHDHFVFVSFHSRGLYTSGSFGRKHSVTLTRVRANTTTPPIPKHSHKSIRP